MGLLEAEAMKKKPHHSRGKGSKSKDKSRHGSQRKKRAAAKSKQRAGHLEEPYGQHRHSRVGENKAVGKKRADSKKKVKLQLRKKGKKSGGKK